MDSIKIIQLTDLHLFEASDKGVGWCDACLNLNTEETLQTVLNAVESDHPLAENFVVTGDISQQPTAMTYQRFVDLFNAIPKPVYCLPGNHDDANVLLQTLPARQFQVGGYALKGNWLWVFMDSSQADEEPSGYLSKVELQRLESLLTEYPNHHAMIFVHHHPVDIGSAWLDEIGINNRAALWALVSCFKQVKSIVFGHVHQEFDEVQKGVRILGTPSTCIQFKPQQQAFSFDERPPAYRWLELHADGEINTGVNYMKKLMLREPARE